jgi:SAM-dependent methyltransferase
VVENKERAWTMILNLGCGKKTRADSVNVDVMAGFGVDHVCDLSYFPWPFLDGSADGIYASHFIEHFQDQKQVIRECYRILKPGGFLHLTVPHSSCITSIGCLGHYRTYSYDTFKDYLSKPWYMFGTQPMFRTTFQELRWWYELTGDNVPWWMMLLIAPADLIINWFIKLSPRVFENLWWPWVGGARELCWIGKKI